MNIYNETNNVIIHETSVDFVLRPCFKEIHVVQFDKTLPVVKVELFKNGEKYIIPDEAAINIRFGKLDHTFVMKPVLGCNEEKTAVYFEVDEQMTVIAGRVSPVLEMVIGSNIAYSSPIGFVIDKNPVQMSDVESATVVYPVIYELIGTVAQFESRISALESQLVDLDSLESRVGTLEGTIPLLMDLTTDQSVSGVKTIETEIDFSNASTQVIWSIRQNQYGNIEFARNNAGLYSFASSGLFPNANNVRDLGAASLRWKYVYLAGGIDFGTKVSGRTTSCKIELDNYDGVGIWSNNVRVLNVYDNGIFFNKALKPNADGTIDIGGSSNKVRDIYLSGVISDGNSTYGLLLPDTTVFTANKTIAMIDDIPTNLENGTGTNAVRQKMADATVDFTGRNPNAEALDPTISATINTGATGNQSSAFGKNTMSLATASFTNGNKTLAKGEESHAEGYQSVTLGNGSHAEGTATTAYAEASHSEGSGTVAYGLYSHSEGVNNWSKGESSHAEGDNNESNGYGSHVEGAYTYTGDEENIPSSRPEDTSGGGSGGSGGDGGSSTVNKQGNGAHAEGFYTVAVGNYSHSEGYVSDAIGLGSHAEGGWNTASGELSHAEGKHNTASGYCSHVAGLYNTAGNAYQTVIGRYNLNKTNTVFEIGWGESESNRKNIFEVYHDGHAEIGLMGSTNLSVATKGYVDGLLPKLYKHIITHNQLGANEKLIVFSFYATLDENSYLALQKIVDRAIFVGLIPSSTSDANYYQIIMNRSSAGVNCMGYYFSSTTPTSVTVYNPMVNGHITDTITEI